MDKYRRIIERLSDDELKVYAEVELSREELNQMTREQIIEFLMEEDRFETMYEGENEDYEEMMHPNETNEEFYEHEAPDKEVD